MLPLWRELGHFRRECPKALASVPYPLPNVSEGLMAGESICERGKNVAQSGGECTKELTPEIVACEGEGGHGRCWEVQEGDAGAFSVRGRLGNCVQYWEQVLHAPPWVLDTVRNGYILPFYSLPTPYSRPNQRTALLEREFVNGAVSDLQNGGYIEEAKEPPVVCSPLSVVMNGVGKKRLVVNLRHVNGFLWKQKFKYEDIRVAMAMFEKGEWMFSFDLKSGYHHVDVAQQYRKYLGFEWGGVTYTFVVLPFGLSSAPYVFTKMMRPLVRLWRSKGIKAIVYLDDGIVSSQNESSAKASSAWVRDTLDRAGWVCNEAKSVWVPTHELVWLGFNLNLSKGSISVPEGKVRALQHSLKVAVKTSSLLAKTVASLIGRIISMSLALGPVARFRTRALYALLESRQAWCDILLITQDAGEELRFWVECFDQFNSQPIWHSPAAVRCVYSDASDTGYGGYTVEHGMHVAQGNWLPDEAVQSSTWRELVAVGRVLEAVAHKLSNVRVRWFTDNQNVVRILQVGSAKSHIQVEALKVFKACIQYNIRLEPEWIPRERNELADYISRIVDYDDWQLDPAVFAMLNALWGPYSVDRFASSYNTQLVRFNSRFASPGTEAVDAFTVDWHGENNWWCPPPSLVPRVIRHMETCKAHGTLVVPCWESAPFWPLLWLEGEGWAPFIVDTRSLPLSEWLVRPGRSGGQLFKGKFPNTAMLAVCIDFGGGSARCADLNS